MAAESIFPYRYVWGAKYPRTLDRKGQRCRVLVRGKMNSALVEFEDGFKAVISRNSIRKASGDAGSNPAGASID